MLLLPKDQHKIVQNNRRSSQVYISHQDKLDKKLLSKGSQGIALKVCLWDNLVREIYDYEIYDFF